MGGIESMSRVRIRGTAAAIVVLGAGLALPAAPSAAAARVSAASPPSFDSGRILAGQGGGEPSLAVDLSPGGGGNTLYVEAIGGWGSSPPPGDPSGSGPVLWHSYDRGATWSAPVPFDTSGPVRGGDGDVVVDNKGNVIVTDLNVSHAWVQVSTDHGKTFNSGTATAPEDDRPWLTASGSNVYVAYHDFVAELPVVCTSTDGGQSFGACNPFTMTDPGVASQCLENTIPARPLSIDPVTKSLNFLFSCSTTQQNAQDPPYGPLHDYYLAQSTDGGQTWSDYKVFLADTSGGKQPNYASIFSTLGIDTAGNYYAVYGGTADDPHVATNPYHVYLVTSKDHGHTWSKPVKVDTDAAGTHVMPHFVVTSPGNIDIAYYGTAATGEPNGYCGQFVQSTLLGPSPCDHGFARFDDPSPKPPLLPPPAWNVYVAQSTTALSATPKFTQVQVTKQAVHYGEICTNGIVCGSSDRSLLDFLSVGVDCRGDAHLTFAGNTIAEEKADFSNGAANIHVANQVGGRTLAPPSGCPAPPKAAPAGNAAPSPPSHHGGAAPAHPASASATGPAATAQPRAVSSQAPATASLDAARTAAAAAREPAGIGAVAALAVVTCLAAWRRRSRARRGP
jgi:hypothetical protein